MTVPARPANYLTKAANPTPRPSAVRAGTYTVELGAEVVTGWHSHDFHQVKYAFDGIAEVETEAARFLLAPQQVLWIPAGVAHCSTLTQVKTVSVFFDPAMGLLAGDRVRVLAAAPVIREMMLYARRWPIHRPASDAMADAFFSALAALVTEWLPFETTLYLPTARDPLVAAAMDYTRDHLAAVTLSDVCHQVGTSERSLRRAFLADPGISWRQYLQQSRLLKAMALLAQGDRSLLEISFDVGFESASALTRAFHQYTGETPSSYRQRVSGAHVSPVTFLGASGADADKVIRGWSHPGRSAPLR